MIKYNVNGKQIELAQGSITRYSADALVCPANPDLEAVAFPGGVQYAFFIDGGKDIFLEVKKIGDKMRQMPMDTQIPMAVPETSAHLTSAGNLNAKHVIHSVSVGYDIQRDNIYCDPEIIAKSTKNALNLAKDNGLKSIGFPALGTGLYKVPLEDAIEAMNNEFIAHLTNNTSLERIGLVLFSPDDYILGRNILEKRLTRV